MKTEAATRMRFIRVAALLLCGFALLGCSKSAPRWEYKVEKLNDDSFVYAGRFTNSQQHAGKFLGDDLPAWIQRDGSEGWELVSATIEPGNNAQMILIFKRQVK